MKKLYFIRHMHGKYIGPSTNDQDVEFEKARVFTRRSDATLAFKAQRLDDDLYSIFVLEVSPTGMQHSQVKPAKPTSEKPRKTIPSAIQGIRSPDEEDNELLELNLRSFEELNPYDLQVDYSPRKIKEFIPYDISDGPPPQLDRTVTVSPDINKTLDSGGNEVKKPFIDLFRWWE